jgi:hypothetical protein
MDEQTVFRFSAIGLGILFVLGIGVVAVVKQLQENAKHLHKEIADLRAQLARTFTPEFDEDRYYGFPMRTADAVEAIRELQRANIPKLTRIENELTAIRGIMIKQKQGPAQTA